MTKNIMKIHYDRSNMQDNEIISNEQKHLLTKVGPYEYNLRPVKKGEIIALDKTQVIGSKDVIRKALSEAQREKNLDEAEHILTTITPGEKYAIAMVQPDTPELDPATQVKCLLSEIMSIVSIHQQRIKDEESAINKAIADKSVQSEDLGAVVVDESVQALGDSSILEHGEYI